MGAECYNVEITPEAEADLRGIYRYIADEKGNPPAAFRLVSLIYGEIAKLDTMPDLEKRAVEISRRSINGSRKLPCVLPR